MSESFFHFLNGMVAGWSQVFVMQPFEIIKVRLQTQDASKKIYTGIVDCLTKIVKNEGPLALYKGTLTPFIGVGILGSIRFGLFENIKKMVAERRSTTPSKLTLPDIALSAFISGIFTSLLVCPIEHTRIRIQIQRSAADKVYSGSLDAAKKIFQQEGIRGLNRGQAPTTIRQSTGLMFYMTIIEELTLKLTPAGVAKKDVPIYVPIIAGGIGGTSYWVFNYPFDYVKTLMQTDKFKEFKYRSMMHCFQEQFRAHGIQGFFKGYLICMMRSFPVNSAAIVTYRLMQRLTQKATH